MKMVTMQLQTRQQRAAKSNLHHFCQDYRNGVAHLGGPVFLCREALRRLLWHMTSTPPPGPGIGPTYARVGMSMTAWIATLVPLTLAYLYGAFYFVREVKGASKLLSLTPNSAEAVLVDLIFAALPMIGIIIIYIRFLTRNRHQRRVSFVAAMAGETLVHVPTYPALIYRMQDEQLQIVWNSDGSVAQGQHYPVPSDITLRPFNTDHFIAHGTP